MLDASTGFLVNAVWRGLPPDEPDDRTLAAALVVARRNEVSGRLARACPERLAEELRAVAAASRAFREALSAASGRLAAAQVPHVLIKADPSGDHVYGNFDLVVAPGGWDRAIAALDGWAVRRSVHPLEREKLLLHPADGPAAHLHRSVSWFDVPVLTAEELLRDAVPSPDGPWRVPDPPGTLLVALAHVAFQTLELTLAELLALRPLLTEPVVAQARERAAAGGWAAGFELAVAEARELARRLDAGRPARLPHPLPVALSCRVGVEHAAAGWATGRRLSAARELGLRPVLIAAKRRRARLRDRRPR